MQTIKELQLENERALYQQYASENRRDIIAEIVLDRMQKEINNLERAINEKKKHRNAINEFESACGFIRNVFKNMYRSWSYKNLRDNGIFAVFKSASSKTKESF